MMSQRADKKKTLKPPISQKLKCATKSNQEFLPLFYILELAGVKIPALRFQAQPFGQITLSLNFSFHISKMLVILI